MKGDNSTMDPTAKNRSILQLLSGKHDNDESSRLEAQVEAVKENHGIPEATWSHLYSEPQSFCYRELFGFLYNDIKMIPGTKLLIEHSFEKGGLQKTLRSPWTSNPVPLTL
jgi:hypothetical protein